MVDTNKLYKEKIFKVYLVGIILSLISFIHFFAFTLFESSGTSISADLAKINIGFLSEGNDPFSIIQYWVFNLGKVLEDQSTFTVNIDYLNTQAYYHLMLIFLEESQEKQVALLQAYSNYLSITLAQKNEQWGFKEDGTAWHHNGHYPAYGIGAFRNVPKPLNILSKTLSTFINGFITRKKIYNIANKIPSTKLYLTQDKGITKKILKNGDKSFPTNGQLVTVHYIGTLSNGSEFDSSYKRIYPSLK